MAFKPTDLVFANRDLDNKLKKLNRRIVSAARNLGIDSDTYIKLKDAIQYIAMDTGSHINIVGVQTPSGKTEQVDQISRGGEMKNLDAQTMKAVDQTLAEVENVTVSDEMKKIGDKIGVSHRTKLGKAAILKTFMANKLHEKDLTSQYYKDHDIRTTVAEYLGLSRALQQYYETTTEFRYLEIEFDRVTELLQQALDLKIASTEQEITEIQKRIDNLVIEINALEEEEEKLQGYDLGIQNAKEIADKTKELEEENEHLDKTVRMLEFERKMQVDLAQSTTNFSIRRQARKNAKKG